jgi:quinol-cytochrome oxidoreductase complex cytochrome b subunit
MSEASRSEASRGWLAWLERRINLTEIFSFLTHFGFVYMPVDTARPVGEVVRELATEPVASYTRGPRILGLLAAILIGLQAVTGVLLAYYYRPTPQTAFESTSTIVRDLPAGWFIHQMHAWGAYLLVAVIVLRMLRFFWDGLYRAPRELLWMSAVVMAWLVLQLDFTGRLLTWDARTYWSTVRGLEVVWALPVVGPILAFLLGGRVVNEDVLIRFYVLHAMVLPVAYAAFLYVTFGTLRRVGVSLPPVGHAARVTTFRDHLYSMAILGVLLFGALVTLATLLPFGYMAQADPYHTPGGVRPPWYMLAPYAVLQGLPIPTWITGLLLVAAAFAVLFLPFLIRSNHEAAARRVRIGGLIVLSLWTLLSVAGAMLDRRR